MAEIVAIGASQGGVRALKKLVTGLPGGFETPIVVVLHIGAQRSVLPTILDRPGGLSVSHAVDGEPIRAGHIHVAPPDHHMIVEDGHIRLSRGPRENWVRPAIDPLFRSVARAFGPGATGIVLSGALNDGTAGLYEIKQRGGIAIVQDPADAEVPSMPQSALSNVAVDYCVPLTEIPPLLSRLSHDREKQTDQSTGASTMADAHKFAAPVAQTCPECGGAMREVQLGTITQFRCHIGHVMTVEVLAAAKLDILEGEISACTRAANERADLCREIARKYDAHGDAVAAQIWKRAAEQAAARAQALADLAEEEWIHPESEPRSDTSVNSTSRVPAL